MLTHTSSHSPRRDVDAGGLRFVDEPYDASYEASWRLEALYACARACALGWCVISPSLFFAPCDERADR